MFNIWFDFCALCILVVLLCSIYTRKGVPIFQNRVFSALTWLALLSTLCDFLVGLWQNASLPLGPTERGLLEFLNCLYFLTRNATPFVYAFYIIAALRITPTSRVQIFGLFFPIAVDVALIALTPSFQLVFYLDAAGGYHRGDFLTVLYVIAVYYMCIAIGLTAYYRKAIPLTRQLALYSFASLAMAAVVVQALFPTLLVEGFATAICILLLTLTIQRPEDMFDSATGFLNRSAFLTMLTVKFRQNKDFTILLVSIDDFLFLEKSLGLRTTNRLLAQVLAYLRRQTKFASFYRISEGRICLLLSHSAPPGLADHLLKMFRDRALEPWQVGDITVMMPAHFTPLYCPAQAETPQEVLSLIETIAAPDSRRDAPAPPSASLDRQRVLEKVVERAVENHLLEVYYQPIYCPEKGRFVSAEALLRLRDPVLGFVPPDEFIPIAEKTGAILQMGRFVLDSVCRFLKENQLRNDGIDYIEVNLSVMECLQDDLMETVLRTMRKYGVETNQINFEITETAASTMPEAVCRNLDRLSRAGIRFSLDDYGTGYSNITRMLSMPLSIIKIDRSVVQRVFEPDAGDAKIVLHSTFQMLRQLQKSVLAEGVETREQADYLIQLGCDYIQGYYYARPLPGDAFLEKIRPTNQMPELLIPAPAH